MLQVKKTKQNNDKHFMNSKLLQTKLTDECARLQTPFLVTST